MAAFPASELLERSANVGFEATMAPPRTVHDLLNPLFQHLITLRQPMSSHT